MARRKDAPTGPSEALRDDGVAATAGAALEPEVAPVADPGADPVTAAPPPADKAPVPPPPRRSGGVVWPLIGGALAAVGGFVLGQFDPLGRHPPDPAAALAALDQRLTEGLATTVAVADLNALAARIAALEAAPPPEAPDLSALDDVQDRLARLEAMPPGGDGAGASAALAARLNDRLTALERRLEAQPQGAGLAEVEAALARLAEAEAQTARQAAAAEAAAARDRALAALRAAVAQGAGFEAELAALDDPALTQALAPHAAGVPTLATLQAEFPTAARAVLDAARAETADQTGWGARLLDFLAAQTNARSVTPRPGDDPDAILSRAEFALRDGRLAEALAELQALPAPLQAPLAGWTAQAEARRTVDAVLEGL